MTTPPTEIEVQCPQCDKTYEGWYRPSINLTLAEPWTEEDIQNVTTVKCPHCGMVVQPGSLVVDANGIFHQQAEEHPASLFLTARSLVNSAVMAASGWNDKERKTAAKQIAKALIKWAISFQKEGFTIADFELKARQKWIKSTITEWVKLAFARDELKLTPLIEDFIVKCRFAAGLNELLTNFGSVYETFLRPPTVQ